MPFKDLSEGQTNYLDENGKLVGEVPIHDVIEHIVEEKGLYKRFETRYTINAPIEVFFDNVVGLRIGGGDPIFLKFDAATINVIEGQTHTVLIRETYVSEESE